MAGHSGSQDLLVTVLGTYFFGQRKAIPSAFLVRVLEEFDVTEIGARNGLSRVTKRGLLEVTKPGRSTYYRLSDSAHEHHAERLSEIVNFGDRTTAWDGTWSIVMFSVAEKNRSQRHRIRHRLGAMRFAPLYDGVWVRPGPPPLPLRTTLKSLELQKATVISGARVEEYFGLGDPILSYSVGDLEQRYETFIATFGPLLERVEAGSVGAAEALVQRTTVMQQWRYFPDHDSLLPAEILPPEWPLRPARDIFVGIYDGLAELADHRLRQLLDEYDPKLSIDVHSLTSAELRHMAIQAKEMGPLTGMP
nr:PaaX family transcriptional regulator C-terminal domain-containing protein [Rhodococcus wratislaviensis]GLK40030.1 PaaX family transcriptional regulator [Rhodococcus wratislaviensis]